MDNQKSDIIGDNFRLISRIGQGSFGEVHKGQNIISNELVAIKMVIYFNILGIIKCNYASDST